jgi:hypothetical protein
MHTQQNVHARNGRSYALPLNPALPEDLRAELLHEKREIERRLRAIDAALNSIGADGSGS